jgi:CDP-paratose 2-epimerase
MTGKTDISGPHARSLAATRSPVARKQPPGAKLRDRFGICQWFHFQDHETLHRAVDLLHELGIRHLRTGISWADHHRPGAGRWYEAVFEALRDFDLLVSIWHTPPSLSEGGHCASPPRRLLDFADFTDQVISDYGGCFSALELWNEPNNRFKWLFDTHDPQWRKFGEMVGCAAYWARHRGVRTVLGGMMPVDPHWLRLMDSYGALPQMDVVGIHGFPGMWWPDLPNWDWHSHWSGWGNKLASLAEVAGKRPIWITETGFATWDLAAAVAAKFKQQELMLLDAIEAPAARTYWYSLIDLSPEREAIEGFHVDENEYHLGLVTHDGRKKPAFHTLRAAMTR